MKISKIIFSFFILFYSCKEIKNNLEFSYMDVYENIGKCYSGDDVYIKIKYPYFKENDTLNKILEKFLITDFTDVTSNIKGIILNFKNDYLDITKLYPNEKIKCWYVLLDLDIIKDTIDIITFKQYHDEDRGGEHPIINTYYLNYDKKNNEIIDLENISYDFDKLTLTAKDIFFKNYNIKSENDLEEKFIFRDNEFYLPDNFYFTENSINFIFGRGEINFFSKGEFLLEIPYNLLENNLIYKY